MDPKQLLKEHIEKTVKLSEEVFDEFYNSFSIENHKKGAYILPPATG